jgi:hypothetical protein
MHAGARRRSQQAGRGWCCCGRRGHVSKPVYYCHSPVVRSILGQRALSQVGELWGEKDPPSLLARGKNTGYMAPPLTLRGGITARSHYLLATHYAVATLQRLRLNALLSARPQLGRALQMLPLHCRFPPRLVWHTIALLSHRVILCFSVCAMPPRHGVVYGLVCHFRAGAVLWVAVGSGADRGLVDICGRLGRGAGGAAPTKWYDGQGRLLRRRRTTAHNEAALCAVCCVLAPAYLTRRPFHVCAAREAPSHAPPTSQIRRGRGGFASGSSQAREERSETALMRKLL